MTVATLMLDAERSLFAVPIIRRANHSACQRFATSMILMNPREVSSVVVLDLARLQE